MEARVITTLLLCDRKCYVVRNFTYNGFNGYWLEGNAPYTAQFNKWTEDPGIALCDCSDGKQRRIPGWALPDFNRFDYPEQDMTIAKAHCDAYGGFIFIPSHS